MGMFDFFKKKAAAVVGNELETLLEKAAKEPSYRSEFYKKLLSEELFVLTNRSMFPNAPAGKFVTETETTIQIRSYDDGRIPVFTSTKRMFDKGVVKKEVTYLAVKGADLFNFTKGSTLILNPYSDYGKELLPEEIQDLLDGTILQDRLKTMTIEKDTSILLGQPANYPTAMVNSLKDLFSRRPAVVAGYLALIQYKEKNEPPHYIIGIKTEGDASSITDEAGFTAKQSLKPEEFVDLVQIQQDSPITDYMLNQTTPFYLR